VFLSTVLRAARYLQCVTVYLQCVTVYLQCATVLRAARSFVCTQENVPILTLSVSCMCVYSVSMCVYSHSLAQSLACVLHVCILTVSCSVLHVCILCEHLCILTVSCSCMCVYSQSLAVSCMCVACVYTHSLLRECSRDQVVESRCKTKSLACTFVGSRTVSVCVDTRLTHSLAVYSHSSRALVARAARSLLSTKRVCLYTNSLVYKESGYTHSFARVHTQRDFSRD